MLQLALCLSICSLLINVPYIFETERNVHAAVFGCNVLYMPIRSSSLVVLYKYSIFLLYWPGLLSDHSLNRVCVWIAYFGKESQGYELGAGKHETGRVNEDPMEYY